MNKVFILLPVFLVACAEVPYQGYPGAPKPETEVAVVRLWTPTTTNIFTLIRARRRG
jgi:hypothetical protein